MADDLIHLKVTQGADTGKTFRVPLNGADIGRASDNDIALRDPLLSRRHCKIEFRPDAGMWLTDLGSANKTRVNNKEITATELHTGDTIQLGDTVLNVISCVRAPARSAQDDAARAGAAARPDALAPRIPGYQVIEEIGSGGMAVVWKARQESLDRIVAIKVLKHELTRYPREVQDFIREARAAARLRHPNIVRVHDAAELGKTCYIVMEYVEGDTLGETLERTGPMSPREALQIVSRVAHALASAWTEAHIIHRGIKPDNIILDNNGTVKLTDLGLACAIDPATLTSSGLEGVIEGTPNFMSPEQARGEGNIDCRTDMYGLGATLYNLVTGQMPFSGVETVQILRRQITDQIPNPRNLKPEIPIGVSQLIAKLMMKDPDHRFPDWQAMLKTLRKVQSGGMILGEGDQGAVSTVAAQVGTPGGKKERKSARPRLPAVVRCAAWLILLLWFLLLGYHQLSTRLKKGGFGNGSGGADPEATGAGGGNEADMTPSQLADLSRIVVASPKAIPASLRGQFESDRLDLQTLPAAEPVRVEAMSAEEKAAFELARRSAAALMIRGRFLAAFSAVSKTPLEGRSDVFADGIAQLKHFIQEVSGMDVILAENFDAAVGKTVTVHIDGRDRELALRAMSDDRINAVVVDRGGGQATTNSTYFSFAELDPIERSRWLGPADTRPKCAMKYLLYLERGEKAMARLFAANCGVLSEPFLEAARGTE